jgi:hypothetical protein
MKFETEMRFDASADEVMRMFSDVAYFEKKYKASGFRNIEVLSHEKTDTRFNVTIRYSAPADSPLPDFAKKFMPDEAVVTQTDTWDLRARTGELKVELKGVPAKVSAQMRLSESGAQATNRLQWNVSCGIPLVGGKLEKIIANDIQSKADADHQVSVGLLGPYRNK